jgi:N-acetylglucosaminyl transferase component (Gpi1)
VPLPLRQVPPRGRCAIGATSPESKLQRVLQILDAMAPHVCVDPCKSTAVHSLARLMQSQAHVRACWPQSAVCSELAVRADVVRKGPGSHLHTLALLLCADWLCGAALSHVLLNHQQMVTQLVNHGVAALMQRAPAGTAHWFWGAKPLGIKLHAHVCQALSTALLQFAHANAVAGTHAARCTAPALRLLAAAGCLPFLGGLSMQCALLADMLLLLGLPLMALRAVAFAWLHLHWAGIKNLHHKLYRPPASSTPPPFRMERLTVGSLLLAPLLLLAPTLCAYGAVVALLAALPIVGGSCVRVAPQSAAFVLAALLSRLQTRSCAASAWMEPHTHANVMRLRRGCE